MSCFLANAHVGHTVPMTARPLSRIWNPKNGTCDAVLGGHSGTVGALFVLCPDSRDSGDPGMEGGEIIVSGSGDATVRLWNRTWEEGGETWACLAVLEGHR